MKNGSTEGAGGSGGTGGALLVSRREVARLMGCCERHVRNLEHTQAMLRPVRLGRKVMWSRVVLERWIEAGCPSPATWEATSA